MTDFAKAYGDGLFLLSQEEGLVLKIEQDLTALHALFALEPDYPRLLSTHAIPREERLSLCDEALKGKIHPYTLNFVKILIERGAVGELKACLERFHARALEADGVIEAKVTSARPLDASQAEALKARLSQISGKTVELIETIDPTVIGGLRVDMQGKRYDNTIQRRMADMRRQLTGAGV